MEKKIFETETIYDAAEFIRYIRFISPRHLKKMKMYEKIVGFVCIAVGTLNACIRKNPKILLAYIVLLVCVMAIFYLYVSMKEKSQYEAHPEIKDLKFHYDFYEDHLEGETKLGTFELDYSDIYNIGETKQNLYIMQNEKNGMVLIKNNLRPEEISFVRSLSKFIKQ